MNNPVPVWVPQHRIADSFGIPQTDNPETEDLFSMIARLVDPEAVSVLVGLGTQELYSQYIQFHSGAKWASPYVNRMYAIYGNDGNAETLSYYGQLIIARDIAMRFKDIWQKRLAAYEANYNLLDSYQIEIEGTKLDNGKSELTHGHSISGTDATTYGRNITTDNTDNYGHIIDGNASGTTNQFGFNTQDAQPVPVSSTTSTDKQTHSGSDTSNSTTSNTGTDSTTVTRTNSGKDTTTVENDNAYQETRKGRLGWHTPQDLISKDLELWKQDLMSTIFNDIDSVLVIKIY